MRRIFTACLILYVIGALRIAVVSEVHYYNKPSKNSREHDMNEMDEVDVNGSKAGVTVEEDEIIFKYYNSKHLEGERIFIENVSDDNLRGWRMNTPLKIVTHGWLSSESSGSVDGIKNAYIAKTYYNVITVDWSETASWKAYPLPAYMTWQVGGFVARLIDSMVKKYLVSLDNVHVIGHSLGSHVAGATGAQVKSGKIGRITGLDPAGPAFEVVNHVTHNSLDTSDAEFVDVIHTAGGAAGFYDAIGHADFYPNGGTPIQPGCFEGNSVSDVVASFSCSHGRAYLFYADSIIHPHSFKAYQCKNWESFENKSCKNHPTVYMGDETPSTARGVYYLLTRAHAPYGLQNRGTSNY